MKIQQIALPLPDATLCRERYGIQFIPAASEVDGLLKTCARLARRSLEIVDFAVTRPAHLHVPQFFLSKPLSKLQAAIINERETQAVANYCLSVQAQLKRVAIHESFDKMIHLPTLFNDAGLAVTFSDAVFPDLCEEWAGKPQEFWVREGFATRLIVLERLLESEHVSLHFEEAFRPVGVQEAQFKRRVSRTRTEHPDWSEAQVLAEAKTKTASTPRLASHKGGAAVDVSLRDIRTGTILDFGHEYSDGGVLVFPQTPFVTARQWQHRQLLQVAAGLCGLTMYVGEDWHISFGDNLASLDAHGNVREDYIAIYGPVKEFDHLTGSIAAIYKPAELDNEFTYQ